MQEIREKELGGIGNDQGGLHAWLLCRQRWVLGEVAVVVPGLNSNTWIYRKEEGEGETYKQ